MINTDSVNPRITISQKTRPPRPAVINTILTEPTTLAVPPTPSKSAIRADGVARVAAVVRCRAAAAADDQEELIVCRGGERGRRVFDPHDGRTAAAAAATRVIAFIGPLAPLAADGDAQHFPFRQPDRGLDLGALAAGMAAVAGITALPAADIEQIPAGVRHRPGLEGFVLEWEVDRLLGKGNSRREETREECDPKTAYPADNAEAGRNSFSPVGGK